ncbi:hypothetical protein F1721_07525 [Saccharopolyspora hirsuta]|uniref:Uncharacterized protein n=1 Tax=Saccharopolyspora hirsuta TaxID=1837 RepID=A0A5M7C8Z6_SACHI|nr:hypothetical protein [Saccharopolyspora hirsuta]KAA5836171.1 hypothetical protein F1721_07525 [Saccharopolyspora hirsuta]
MVVALARAAPETPAVPRDGEAPEAGAAVTFFPPKNLPWHVRAGDHVYIYAGGELVRRMHLTAYQAMAAGVFVHAEHLAAEHWATIEEFTESCAEHEEQQRHKFLMSLPKLVIDQHR